MPVEGGWALVLGGGGTVGAAYTAGVLRALVECGVDVHRPDLLIGTSAGALVGTRLRCGADVADLVDVVQPRPRDLGSHPRPGHVEKAWSGRADLARRVVSSGAVVAGTLLKVPLPEAGERVRRIFPGGLYRVSDQELFEEMIPEEWPDRAIWIMAMDLRTRRRVAFGRRRRDRECLFRDAVRASCAVPGLFEPVSIAGHHYVDGGTRSSTSLDFAWHVGVRRAIIIAPMAYDPATPPPNRLRLLRRPSARELWREVAMAEPGVQDALVFHPSLAEISLHGNNMLRPGGGERIAAMARETSLRALEEPARAALLEQLLAA